MMSWPNRMCPQRSGSAMVSANQNRLNPASKARGPRILEMCECVIRVCRSRLTYRMREACLHGRSQASIYQIFKSHGLVDFFLDF